MFSDWLFNFTLQIKNGTIKNTLSKKRMAKKGRERRAQKKKWRATPFISNRFFGAPLSDNSTEYCIYYLSMCHRDHIIGSPMLAITKLSFQDDIFFPTETHLFTVILTWLGKNNCFKVSCFFCYACATSRHWRLEPRAGYTEG